MSGMSMSTWNDMELVRKVVKKDCFVAKDFKEEMSKFTLPDENSLEIAKFKAPELYFESQNEKKSILEMVDECFNLIDKDMKKQFGKDMNHIVIGGAPSLVKGLEERLSIEFQKYYSKREFQDNLRGLKVIAPAERAFSSWIGGSIYSSLSTFQNSWITKDDYDDIGVHSIRRCRGVNIGLYTGSWSRETHTEFPTEFQKNILCVIWCNIQEDSEFYNVPKDALFVILSFLGWSKPLHEKDIEFATKTGIIEKLTNFP